MEQRGVYTLKYNGSSANDPYVCKRLDPWGKPELQLFNLYQLSDGTNTPEANARAKAGMSDLLSGRKTTVSFPYPASNGFVQTLTWLFLRKEPYTVDGKTFETMVFALDLVADPRGRSNCHGQYVQWLDPKTGFWLKSDLSVRGGECSYYPRTFQVSTITAL